MSKSLQDCRVAKRLAMTKRKKDCFGLMKLVLAMTSQKAMPVFLLFSLSTNLTLPWISVGEQIAQIIGIKETIEKAVIEELPTMKVVATAYSSTHDQTDETPFTTAANTETRDGVVAANFLKFHTKIKIPELYGDKIFTVEDRMNRRYNESVPPRIDIWLPERQLAKNFGVQKVEIVILN